MKRRWILWVGMVVLGMVGLTFCWWGIIAAWSMREDAIPGRYSSDGAWGTSTLVLRSDHTFSQAVTFTNEFNEAKEGNKKVQGIWTCTKHSLWSNQIELRPFIQLAPLRHQVIDERFDTSYSMMILAPVIEVDPGAGIYYSK